MRPREAVSALSLGFLKMVNLRLLGLYLFTRAEVVMDTIMTEHKMDGVLDYDLI